MSILSDKRDRVLSRLGGVQSLPALPTVLIRLNEAMANPDVDVKEVAAVIATDPAVTGGILRIVNSPFYGLQDRVATVAHATMLLGFNTVRTIATSQAIVASFGGGSKSGNKFSREAFWVHSISCGAACRAIARRVGDAKFAEEYFTAGLLHDIGKVIEDEVLTQDFGRAVERALWKGGLLRDAEIEIFGCDHAEVGGVVFENWKLAPSIVAGVAFHHEPQTAGAHARIASVVHLADICVRALLMGNGGDQSIPVVRPFALENLGITPKVFPELLTEVKASVADAASFFDMVRGA